jgi:hypothetical protein
MTPILLFSVVCTIDSKAEALWLVDPTNGSAWAAILFSGLLLAVMYWL